MPTENFAACRCDSFAEAVRRTHFLVRQRQSEERYPFPYHVLHPFQTAAFCRADIAHTDFLAQEKFSASESLLVHPLVFHLRTDTSLSTNIVPDCFSEQRRQ